MQSQYQKQLSHGIYQNLGISIKTLESWNLKKDIKIFHTALCNDLLGKSELLMMAEIIASQRAAQLPTHHNQPSFQLCEHTARCTKIPMCIFGRFD